MKYNEALYTENAVFIKDFYYGSIEPLYCDVITITAVNLNKQKIIDYENITKQKMRLMFSMAIENNVDNLILGAWAVEFLGMILLI